MTVNISKPALNLRAELAGKSASAPPARETFWFSGDGSATSFAMPRGWKPTNVFVDGSLKRPGSGEDYTITYDGYAHHVVFAVAPAAVDVAMMCEREA